VRDGKAFKAIGITCNTINMKKFTTLLAFLIALTINVYGQIPNGGFEGLSNWAVGNASLSTDHYPTNVGNFSIKLENHLPVVNHQSYGYAVSGNVSTGCIPSFSLSGHPNQLCGYYKCAPLNNDTIQIGIMLYNNGVWVAGGQLTTTNTVSSWTSFTIPISAYTLADSATIVVAAFYNNTSCGMPYGPFGNSVLYVDNLSFDNLITGIPVLNENVNVSAYPSPFSHEITFTLSNNEQTTVSLYNILGQPVLQQTFTNTTTLNSEHLSNGIYFYELSNSKGTLKTGKLVKQ
jgi:Secretion system C-terminal sorting domain